MQDQVSLDKGDLTGTVFCGARTYTLEDGGTFLSQSGRNLILQTDNDCDVGIHTAKMKITLEEQANLTPLFVDIPIEILPR